MWSELISAAGNSDVNISLILNPASGPGTTTDPNFLNDQGKGPLADFRDAGGHVYGYVTTNYAARSPLDVQADIDRYYDTLFPGYVDGIFFDQMSNDLANVSYYQTIRDYVHNKDGADLVISNPGTSFLNDSSGQLNADITEYANSADVLVTFEGTGADYLGNYTPPSWGNKFSADHFAAIIHGQAAWDDALVDLAMARNTGFIYFTDDALPNPYDKLASYWDQQLSDIAVRSASAVPVPGSIYLFISGLAWLGAHRTLIACRVGTPVKG